jgi:D-3-phosphoglycerate dehydrogenase
MIRILNAEPSGYSEKARAILRSVGSVVERPLTQRQLRVWIPRFDVLIIRLGLEVTRTVLEAAPRLRVIVTATTGTDHIDIEEAARHRVAVLSLQGERQFLNGVPATAEHTWALLLAAIRHIPEAVNSVRAGGWSRDDFRGRELRGKRLGLLGCGRVGEQVAVFARAFGMRIAAFDPKRRRWPSGITRCRSLSQLLRQADVLSVHLPFTAETGRLVDANVLRRLPRGALLINTSRGGLLDEQAVVNALRAKHLAGAAVDVLEGERHATQRRRSPLLAYAKQHRNVLITPHLGGATRESMERTEVFMAEKLRGWLAGHRLR